MTTTDKLIAKVRRLDAAATPGPWYATDDRSPEESGSAVGVPSSVVREVPDDGDGQLLSTVAEFGSAADNALIAEYRTAAPALADAVEARDRVIHQLDETLRMATIENTVDPKSESAATEARWMLEGDFGLELVGGKWRIRET